MPETWQAWFFAQQYCPFAINDLHTCTYIRKYCTIKPVIATYHNAFRENGLSVGHLHGNGC